MRLHLHEDHDGDDPVLSLVNLIDVFLVIIAALLLVLGKKQMLSDEGYSATTIKNAGKPGMEILVRDERMVEHFRASGKTGQGKGVKAGVAYRMSDGSMVYVPE